MSTVRPPIQSASPAHVAISLTPDRPKGTHISSASRQSAATATGTLFRSCAERCRSTHQVENVLQALVSVLPGKSYALIETGLAVAAQTEARLHQLLPPPAPNESPSTIVSYIVALDALQDTLQEELDRSPQAATKLPAPAGGGYSPVTTADDLIQARVTIAWICMLKGEWDDVLRVTPSQREVSEEWDSGGAGKMREGYIHIARIKSLVLQGAYE